MPDPRADVIIAVHSPHRRVERAVASVLDAQPAEVRATVVVHNTDAAPIRARLEPWLASGRLTLLELHDGVPSPSGPFNHGIAATTAPYFAVMGSDDELEPGTVASWIALADAGAEAVIARVRDAATMRSAPTPPVRLGRSRKLNGARDRLSYRSAPLGLLSRARFGHLRFTESIVSGEDIAFSTAVWFSGADVVFDRSGPAYLVHSDADDRVTRTPRRPIDEDMAFLDALASPGTLDALDGADRIALVCKLVRVNVLYSVLNRGAADWSARERAALSSAVRRTMAIAPGARRHLSFDEERLLAVASAPSGTAHDLLTAAERCRDRRTLRALLPRNPLYALTRQAPLRWGLASILIGRT